MSDSTHSQIDMIAARAAARSRWPVVRRVLAASALLGLAYLLWTAWDHQAVVAWKQEAGPLRYFAAMAVLPALGVPISPFFVIAGATFGARLGIAGSFAALAANLTLCHCVARSGLRQRITALLERFGHQLPDFEGQPAGAFRFTLLVKVAPGVPAVAKNYLLGLARVPFMIYFVVSMLFTGFYGVALVVLGESLLEHDLSLLSAAAVLIAGSAFLVWWWRRRINQSD
jgi:uncharacterized membrane protein YdjX (TVP38/TMEM64 family)